MNCTTLIDGKQILKSSEKGETWREISVKKKYTT